MNTVDLRQYERFDMQGMLREAFIIQESLINPEDVEYMDDMELEEFLQDTLNHAEQEVLEKLGLYLEPNGSGSMGTFVIYDNDSNQLAEISSEDYTDSELNIAYECNTIRQYQKKYESWVKKVTKKSKSNNKAPKTTVVFGAVFATKPRTIAIDDTFIGKNRKGFARYRIAFDPVTEQGRQYMKDLMRVQFSRYLFKGYREYHPIYVTWYLQPVGEPNPVLNFSEVASPGSFVKEYWEESLKEILDTYLPNQELSLEDFRIVDPYDDDNYWEDTARTKDFQKEFLMQQEGK